MTLYEWLGSDNDVGISIGEKKYIHPDEIFDEFIDRVSANDPVLKDFILRQIILLGGRTFANRGIDNYASFFNCFVPGTKVITRRGYINIEDVVIGDEVIAEDDQWHRVNDVMKREYVGDLYHIASKHLSEDIICTPNHQLLTQNGWKRADRLEAYPMRILHPDRLKIPNIRFCKEYDNIDLLDYMCLSENQNYTEDDGIIQIHTKVQCQNKYGKTDKYIDNTLQNPFKRFLVMDDDMMYFIGRWLGDGSVTKKRGKNSPNSIASVLQIVFNAEKERDAAERIIRIGTEKFGIEPNVRETNQNVISVRWNSETICNFFIDNFGQYCDGKKIPSEYDGDLNIALGLLDSDGYINTHGRIKIILKNEFLIEWLKNTLLMNGMPPGKVFSVKNQPNTYGLEISTSVGKGKICHLLMKDYWDGRNGNTHLSDLDKNYAPIENIWIEENVSAIVYNLSVEDVHSYTANGVVVHNCYSHGFVKDDYRDIMQTAMNIGLTFKAQGGQGISLSKLRPAGAPIGNEYTSDGIIPFMKIFNEVTAGTSQGGARKGALMISIDARHKEAEAFIKIKSQEGLIEKANLSLEIDDEFMEAVQEYYESGNVVTLHEVRNYDGHIVEYDVVPIDIFKMLVDNCYDWADPAALFVNRFRNYNIMQFDDDYQIETSNPCGRVTASR